MKEQNENELLLAKIDDKIRFCKTRKLQQENDIFIPEKMLSLFDENASNITSAELNIATQFLEIIRILLPNTQIGAYEHRDYLSGIMKFGIVREKIGDIITIRGFGRFVVKEVSRKTKSNKYVVILTHNK